MRWFYALRARLRLLTPRAETRIDREIRFHLDMETERLVRDEGLDPREARRRATRAFGGVQQHRETLREGRGLGWLTGLSLDLKLGFRMLVKYPGLTIVGGLAMAFAIAVGTATFEMVGMAVNPSLPLPDGDRIVQVRNWDLVANEQEPRNLHDFQSWRSTLRSVVDLGAYRDLTANLIAADGNAYPVAAAEITAAAFRIAPTPPLFGRVLDPSDEAAGSPPVVVIGFDVWQNRFGADPGIVGRVARVSGSPATIVGVMPEDFAFPVSHELWMPLRAEAAAQTPRSGPPITVFGRLAPGATFETARAELTTLTRRAATAYPATHAHLQAQITPYVEAFWDPSTEEQGFLWSIDLFAIMLLVLVCGNVALLLFARAATRESEILVRSALGASRRRIVAQLFAEALVLGGLAAVAGLIATDFILSRWGEPYLEVNIGSLPFWYDVGLSPTTALYGFGLAVLGSIIAGVIPARKITAGLGDRLKERTAGGGVVSFGGVWTAVIVTQVAVTVAFPAVVLLQHGEARRIRSYDVGFAASEYLSLKLEMDEPEDEGPSPEADRIAARARFAASLESLRLRLAGDPGVNGVTFVDHLPMTFHPQDRLDVVSDPGTGNHYVSMALIDPSYFDVLATPPIAGRSFNPSDLSGEARVVIVDQGFVDKVLQGRNAIGHQVRLHQGHPIDSLGTDLPRFEIVGVVKNLGMSSVVDRSPTAGLYLPGKPGSATVVQMIVHGRGDPTSLGPRIRALATAVDPTLRISEVERIDRTVNPLLWFVELWIRITIVLTAIALLLSLAGIYAVLSFIVARRTREIGVRVALGAGRPLVITAIFKRPLAQVTAGVVAGAILIGTATALLGKTEHFKGDPSAGLSTSDAAILVGYAAFMLAVCLTACVVPTWRALRVQPTEALRED